MLKLPTVFFDGTDGAGSQPAPVSQQPSPDIQGLLSQALQPFGEQLKNLQGEIRGIQKSNDQGLSAFQKQLSQYEELTKNGRTPQQAIEQMGKVDEDAQWRSGVNNTLKELTDLLKNGGSVQGGRPETGKIFETLGLDLKDPRVALAASKKYETPEQAELEAYRLQRQISQSPNPNAAQNTALNGKNGGTRTKAEITERIKELQYRPTAENDAERADLLKELAGLQ